MSASYYLRAALLILPFALRAQTGSPVITAHPKSQSVSFGANVTFVSGASGADPIRYQWRRNEQNISDATNSTLILTLDVRR